MSASRKRASTSESRCRQSGSSADAGAIRVELDSGDVVEAEKLLVATGRRANVDGLGLEQLGVELTKKGITVDERLRAADDVWAIGDPSGVALLTHVGKYQARVAAANIAGRDCVADYRAIPAAVFTDPQVASVGTMDDDGLVDRRVPDRGRAALDLRAARSARAF